MAADEFRMRACNWSESDTLTLFELWSEPSIQKELKQNYRNKTVYQQIAHLLSNAGIKRSWMQCKEKVKKLKKEYYRLQRNGVGEDSAGFPFYEQMCKLIGPVKEPKSLFFYYS